LNPDTPSSSDTPAKSVTAPLAVWLIVQLSALALAAARVPLSAHFVQPGESLAIHEMLIAQFAASAMLFPFLLRDVRSCLALMITSAPMLQLAGMLSTTPTPRVIGAWTCLAAWLAALTLSRIALPRRYHALGVAIANVLTLGGLMLWYLANEFGAQTSTGHASVAHAFPLVAVLRFVVGETSIFIPLAPTAFLLLAGLIAVLVSRILPRLRACRQSYSRPVHNSSTKNV
jgi:hypothetical protein